MQLRDHTPIILEEFNGLWRRGDPESCPIDHFTEVNNIKFLDSGFETRPGLDTLIAKGNIVRMYNYKLQTAESLILLDNAGDVYHALLDGSNTVYGPILSIPDMTDFGFVAWAGRAYITPFKTYTDANGNNYQKGLEDEFVYVYLGAGASARKAAGFPPSNSEDTPLVAYNNPVAGKVTLGIHVLAVTFSDGSDDSTGLGTTIKPVIYARGEEQLIINNIPIGGVGITQRKIWMTRAINPADWNPDTTTYTYYLAATIGDNTTIYGNINVSDEELVTAFSAGTLPNPTSGGITAENDTTSGYCDLGLHVIGVVYETDTGFLTAPGPEVMAVQTFVDGNRAIKISDIPVSPDSFVTKRHLVASKAINPYNGDDRGFQLFFIPDGTLEDNTTTTKTVSFYDADLLEDASYLLDNFSEIPAGVTLTTYHGRMILTTTFDDISIIYLSATGEPEAIDKVDGLLIMPLDGNPITTAQEFRDVLYGFKQARTMAWTDNGDLPSTWQGIWIDQGIGSPVHGIGTVLDSGGVNIDYLLIVDYSGLMIFNGTYTRPEISWKIQDFWLEQDKNQYGKLQIINDSINQIIYICFLDGTLLVGDYSNGFNHKEIKWTIWTFDVEVTTIAIIDRDTLAIGSLEAVA